MGSLVLNWKELPKNSPSRMAVITTMKLGSAIIRTRARRLLRECFRLHQHDLRALLEMMLVARRGVLGKKLAAVEADYLFALRSSNLLKEAA